MTALAQDRNTARMEGDLRQIGVAASTLIYAGSLAMLNAAGYVAKGQTALNLIGFGRAEERVDNSAGAAGDKSVRLRTGVFKFANSASGDQITNADIGKVAYAVDDQTVAKTTASGTRSPAGFVAGVDDQGVWVELDPAKLVTWRFARRRSVPLRLTTIASAGSPVYRAVSPFSGLVTKIQSVIEGALTTGDATVTGKINGVAITNGVLTITQAGSAAGDKDTADPTAARYVAAGDELSLTVSGTQASATAANAEFEIDAE